MKVESVGKDEFQTACSAACSTGAMKFGDINDSESDVAKLLEDDRMYRFIRAHRNKTKRDVPRES